MMNLKSTKKLLAIAILCSFSVNAQATEWVRVNTGNFDAKVLDYDQYFYDRAKLITKNNPDEITYWRLVVFKKPRSYKGRFVKKTLIREKLNCTEHSTKLLSAVHYDMNDQLVDQSMNVQADVEPVIPNTIGDAYEQTMCKLIPPAPVAPPVPQTPPVGTPDVKNQTTNTSTPTPVDNKKPTPNSEIPAVTSPKENNSSNPVTPLKDNSATVSPSANSSLKPNVPQAPAVNPVQPNNAPRPIAPPPVPISQRSNAYKVKLQSLLQKANQTGVGVTVNKTTLPNGQVATPNNLPIAQPVPVPTNR